MPLRTSPWVSHIQPVPPRIPPSAEGNDTEHDLLGTTVDGPADCQVKAQYEF
jgi:hypothetical protein